MYIDIIRVCNITGLSIEELNSNKRTQQITRVRFFIWYKLRELGMSYSQIGQMFAKNHATIINGVNQEQNRRDIKKKKRKVKFN